MLSLNYIILFVLLLLVNVVNFVAILWICWFYVYLDCPLICHICCLLLARCIIHPLACSLPTNILTSILQNLLMFLRKKLVLPHFHVGPGSNLALVEYWLICFHPFFRIRKRWRRCLCCQFILLLHYIRHLQKIIIIIHSCSPGRIEDYIICFVCYFNPCGMSSRVESACTCLIILGVMGIFFQVSTFYNLVGL